MASELSTATIAMAAEAGATQIEPGHAFTGTSPLQAFQTVPERQAIVYLTEVSHLHSGGAFCFGGGLYECIGAVEHDHEALIGTAGSDGVRFVRARLTSSPPGVIDFYGRLNFPMHSDVRGGETVLICTRPQAFFTRAYVVPVEGIQRGEPRVLGVFNTSGYIAQNAPAHTLSA
jgi:predicted amino acid racemase